MGVISCGASVLVVEDELIISLDLQQTLTELGYSIAGAADTGEDAIALARDTLPDIVLMDIMLRGDMDGIEAAKHIVRGLGIPIIYLTSYSDADTIHRAAETGPYGFLTKPFQAKELRAGIEVAIYKAELERRLRESERWFSTTLDCVADGVIATDAAGRVTFLNPAAEALTRWPVEDALGLDIETVFSLVSDINDGEDDSPVRRALAENVVVGTDYACSLVTRDGEKLSIDDSAAPIRGDNGAAAGAVIVFRDVSKRLEQERRLRSSEERFRSIFETSAIGIALVSFDDNFLQVNESFRRLLNIDEADLFARDHAAVGFESERHRERELLRELLCGSIPSIQIEKRYRRQGAPGYVWTLTIVSLLTEDTERVCFLYQVHDLTEQKRNEIQLERLAYFDTLTGLSNRAHFRHEFERMLAVARRKQELLAVVFIDLDRFKQVNDTLGHEAGDVLIATMAQRLSDTLRESDRVARLGGDEFVLALSDIAAEETIAAITEKIRLSVSMPVEISGHSLIVTPSMGVSLYPVDGEDSQTLLRNADSALYAAKAEGRNRVHFFRPELARQVRERMEVEAALRHAIDRSEFYLEYQPIVRPNDRRILGFEALIRWRHDGRRIAPDSFIPIAEETGLILPIGDWVLHEACAAASAWPNAIKLNVNCSPRQFREDATISAVDRALRGTKMSPERLSLELTEEAMLVSNDDQQQRFQRLREMGIGLSIDDYGTGYSSLAYIKRFSPDALKIDRLFVADMVKDPVSAAIVEATIKMAHSMKLKIVAEGAETEAQVDRLTALDCDAIQGFYYSRPVSAEVAARLAADGTLTDPMLVFQ